MTTLRRATASDYSAFTRLFPQLGVTDPTPPAERWANEMVPTAFVAEESGAVIAYTYFQTFADEGIVRHLVVDAAHRGRKVGEALLRRVADVMRGQGGTRWSLNVEPGNAPALRLYVRLGFRAVFPSQALRFPWDLVPRLPAPGPGLTSAPIAPEEDAEIERSVSLSSGALAAARRLPHRVLQVVREGSAVRAAAVFDPSFPGAYPFRAHSPEAARALLEALRPFARSEPPHMQTVIEGQPELAEALREAGAEVRLDIVHMKGALPAPCAVARR